jgi:hypothetical protein
MYAQKNGMLKKIVSLVICLSLISTFALGANAAATAAPGRVTLSSDQWGGDVDGNYNLTWNMYYGNNGTSWSLHEKIGTGEFTEIHTAAISDATPDAQSGSKAITDKTITGIYYYYVTLTNSFGTTTSNTITVTVGNSTGDILINSVDSQQTVNQFTISQGSADYTLNYVGAATPVYAVATNNTSVISCAVQGSKLTVKGLKAGRASLKIRESTTKVTRYVGVRVKNADGSLPGMPKYLSLGSVSEDTASDLNFWKDFQTGDKNKQIDARYIYINGGPINGWKTWTTIPGDRARNYMINSQRLGIIPFFVYYNIPDNDEGYAVDLNHIQSASYMDAYYKDLKYFLDICKSNAGDDTFGIVFEPDFLGYMMQQSKQQPNQISALVNTAYSSGVLTKGVDPDFTNTVDGLVKSINYITKKYCPNAYFGWQFNIWAYDGPDVPGKGILHLTETMGQTAGLNVIKDKAKLIAAYYENSGVASNGASFVSIDKYGLDGGAGTNAPTDPAGSTWFWNADIWSNYLTFVNTLHTQTKMPVILWQIPVGHLNSSQSPNPYNGGLFPDLDGTTTKYEDSAPVFFLGDTFNPGSSERFNYFKTNASNDSKISDNGKDSITWQSHMQEAYSAGVTSILFGAGVNSSTHGTGSPPTDNYWWITQAQRYYKNPISFN